MKETNPLIQLFAYYLSKYDMEAVSALGYSNRSQAISDISKLFHHDNNYLKLRRDEFDVLTGSHRKGWGSRPVTKTVQELFDYYKQFNYAQLTEMTVEFLNKQRDNHQNDPYEPLPIITLSEYELENIINYHDSTAALRIQDERVRQRVLNRGIIDSLKKLYCGRCQICGKSTLTDYGVSIAEGHHIKPFAASSNNDSNNIIIVCPNHHRLIHATHATFDYSKYEWDYQNGTIEKLILNYHL